MNDRHLPWTDQERLAALGTFEILDTPPEEGFDALTKLAAELLGTSIAAITLVDATRQWFKSEVGFGVRETPLDSSVCLHAIREPGGLVVPDLTRDPRFADSPLVTGPRHLRFYAGQRLTTREGVPIGMLCVLDTAPRPQGITASQAWALRALAEQVTARFELRRALIAQSRASARHRQIIDSTTDHAIIALDGEGRITRFNTGAARITGWSEAEIVGQSISLLFTPEDVANGCVETDIRRAREEGRSPDKRFHVRKGGERFWADGEMRPLLDESGRVTGLVKVFSDRSVERAAERRLSLLADASAELLAADDPNAVLKPLLSRGAELLGFDRAWICRVDPDGRMRIGCSIGDVEMDGALAARVAETRRPLILGEDLAYAGFPVIAGETLHGVLSFGSGTRRMFDEEALSFFATLARFIAVVRERLDRETSLRELNATLERRVAERTRERDRIWQASRDMFGVADGDGAWRSVNPAWTRTLGWPTERIVGRDSAWLEHPEDAETLSGALLGLRSDATLALENRFRASDGSWRVLSWTAVSVEGQVYAVARDMTDERAREQALHDRENFTRLALSAVGGVGIWTYEIAVDRCRGDAAVAELYGLDPSEAAAGVSPDRFFAGVDPRDLAKARRTVEHGVLPSEPDVEFRVRSEGRVRWIVSRCHTERDASGTPLRRTGVGIDITQLRTLEEQLRQAQKMEAVGQLTGGLAHDFNNLLTGIVGSLELLQTRVAQGRMEGVPRYIGAAQDAASRAASLTHRLLAFSRRQTLDPRPVDPARLVDGMVELIRRTVGPSITVETAVTGAGNILADSSQLENAVLNLCINARDAMASGGRLTVEIGEHVLDERAARERELPPGPYVSISVNDEGVGMAPDVVARAFDPFFTTKPIGEGTGLGLSMIYGFVRQSGGQVRIHSEVGHGTTVRMLLPRHGGEAESPPTPPSLSEAPRADLEQSVLVVDDEPTVRMLVTDVLRELGYEALEAVDGVAALEALRSPIRIDLLVTDIGLPGGMDGRRLAEAGRALRPGLKVLFITGYAESTALGAGRQERGTRVLVKPFAMETLASRIRMLLSEDAA